MVVLAANIQHTLVHRPVHQHRMWWLSLSFKSINLWLLFVTLNRQDCGCMHNHNRILLVLHKFIWSSSVYSLHNILWIVWIGRCDFFIAGPFSLTTSGCGCCAKNTVTRNRATECPYYRLSTIVLLYMTVCDGICWWWWWWSLGAMYAFRQNQRHHFNTNLWSDTLTSTQISKM